MFIREVVVILPALIWPHLESTFARAHTHTHTTHAHTHTHGTLQPNHKRGNKEFLSVSLAHMHAHTHTRTRTRTHTHTHKWYITGGPQERQKRV